jgi:hypothetical protein
LLFRIVEVEFELVLHRPVEIAAVTGKVGAGTNLSGKGAAVDGGRAPVVM